jgi:MEDS: MEthanogen/methylotroph, DcmR Sensory domain
MMMQDLTNCYIDDALNHMNQAEYGAHYLIIYQNLNALRELYSNYMYKQIEKNNEAVLINPFYETTNSVRQVLSERYNHGMDDISKYEKEESLIIIDSLEEYFGRQPDMTFKRNLANHAKEIGKDGLSILGDVGAYPHRSKQKELVNYELSLPTKFSNDVPMKGFCLYHQKDFDKFSNEQQQKLIEHHGKAIKILE